MQIESHDDEPKISFIKFWPPIEDKNLNWRSILFA